MEEKLALLRELLAPANQHELVHTARALCPFAEAATDATILLCVAMVEAKGDAKLVSEVTGFMLPNLRGHIQSPLAARIMRQLAKEKLFSTGYIKALAALEDVAGSESASTASRAKAASSIIELVNADDNAGKNRSDGGLELNVMTQAQLYAFVGAIRAQLLNTAPQPLEIEGLVSSSEEGGA